MIEFKNPIENNIGALKSLLKSDTKNEIVKYIEANCRYKGTDCTVKAWHSLDSNDIDNIISCKISTISPYSETLPKTVGLIFWKNYSVKILRDVIELLVEFENETKEAIKIHLIFESVGFKELFTKRTESESFSDEWLEKNADPGESGVCLIQ